MMLTAALALGLVVNVSAPAEVPKMIVTNALAEANAIWSPAGVAFTWQRDASIPARLQVVIGVDPVAPQESTLPLGWVIFADDQTPEPRIHLSYTNTERLFDESRGSRAATRLEHHVLIGRAMGRALAHELGHYLLASKAHTTGGLMQGRRRADEFFSPEAVHFEIDTAQRSQVAARLHKEQLVARR